MILNLDDLGFDGKNSEVFKDLVKHPHGIIFVTGPTGSGKSTTLYAALNSISSMDRKIITLEDPIEYEMPGMIQMQVMPEIGLNFAAGLRSVLRHDPDVIMVGEVRDFETADIAIRFSLTGHLILSTLHTNDAASGITRLIDIGIEPYLIATSVNGFVAQRLVRKICPNCKVEDPEALEEVRATLFRDLQMQTLEGVKIYKGKGCNKCANSGYLGRIAIHEILTMNDEIRRLIVAQKSSDVIKRRAQELGMSTLRQDGWRKVLLGLTTPQEVMRSTPADEMELVQHHIHAEGETEYFDLNGNFKGKDRRKYVRVKVELDVIFHTVDVDHYNDPDEAEISPVETVGHAADISAGGISFSTEEKISAGDVLEIKIKLEDEKIPIACIGKALRVNAIGKSTGTKKEIYSVAVCFLAIHSSDRAKIENYCQRVTTNEKV